MARTLVSRHDSALGQWTRALHWPDAPLSSSVEMLWFVAGRTAFARDRRLPEGKSHLLFNLGDAPTLFARESALGGARRFPTCWIAGQQRSYIETGADGMAVLLGAQFHGHGAWQVLGVPQHELADEVVELEAVLGDRVLGLREQLLQAGSPERCFALLGQWLLARLQRGRGVHRAVLAASRAIAADPGLNLARLGADLGLSREHLIRLFRQQVGLPPKAYANILRFDRTLKLARRERVSWAQIAHGGGYFDQAHLARDFQRYAGRTPTSLLLDRMPDDASVVVA